MNSRDTSPNYVAQAIEEALAQVREELSFVPYGIGTTELVAKEAALASFLDYSKATPSLVTFDVAEEAHARIDTLIKQTAIEIGVLRKAAHRLIAHPAEHEVEETLARFKAADNECRQ
jgi:hypothetical protein